MGGISVDGIPRGQFANEPWAVTLADCLRCVSTLNYLVDVHPPSQEIQPVWKDEPDEQGHDPDDDDCLDY